MISGKVLSNQIARLMRLPFAPADDRDAKALAEEYARILKVGCREDATLIAAVESLAGVFYVAIGLMGLFLAGGFLDNRFLPIGTLGALFSAGAIPIIYTLIGLKVGAEFSVMLSDLSDTEAL